MCVPHGSGLFFETGSSLCSPGWPRTLYIDQAGPKLSEMHPSLSRVLRKKSEPPCLTFVAVFEGLLRDQSESGELYDVDLSMFESREEGAGRHPDSGLVTNESTVCSWGGTGQGKCWR